LQTRYGSKNIHVDPTQTGTVSSQNTLMDPAWNTTTLLEVTLDITGWDWNLVNGLESDYFPGDLFLLGDALLANDLVFSTLHQHHLMDP
jgi:hypothetical protein